MKLLLDTHILLWALQDSPELPAQARLLIADEANAVFYSVASLWEVQIKHAAHPDLMQVDAGRLSELCKQGGYEPLSISEKAVLLLDALCCESGSPAHKDPFGRIMICQAKAAGMVFLTHDALLRAYGESCILYI